MGESKKLGSVWFGAIGIVLMNNGHEEKAYIGSGLGFNQEADEKRILEWGKPFPVKQAREIIFGEE